MSRRAYSLTVIAGAAVAYFLLYPGDLTVVVATVATPVDQILRLTHAVAPWAYAVLIALILVNGAVRIWGRRLESTPGGPASAESLRGGPT